MLAWVSHLLLSATAFSSSSTVLPQLTPRGTSHSSPAADETARPASRSATLPARIASMPTLSLTDDSLDSIIELIQLDAKIVINTAKARPRSAWSLAANSLERRAPLLLWVAGYMANKLWLQFFQCADGHAALVNATLGESFTAELAWQHSQAGKRLSKQRRELELVLQRLRPELRQRVRQAVRDQPRLIPALSTRILQTLTYRLRWRLNQLQLSAGWRSLERSQ